MDEYRVTAKLTKENSIALAELVNVKIAERFPDVGSVIGVGLQ